MRKLLFAGLMGITLLANAASQTIVLKDGSSVSGEVLSMNGGTYQVQTKSMGVIAVPQSEIVTISAGNAVPTANGLSVDASQLQSLQQSIASNPQIMQTIQSLQSDPQFQAILQDPQIMQAIQSGNLNALSQNPKIQQLMNHSAVKDISRQLGH